MDRTGGLISFHQIPIRKEAAYLQKRQVALQQLPLGFIPNQGQMDERVRFYGRSDSASFFFARDEVVYSFVQREGEGSLQKVNKSALNEDSGHEKERTKGHIIRIRFVGADLDPRIEGGEGLSGKVNYFIGNDFSRWKSGLPTYGQVRYRELWPGIDLIYRGGGGQLKYEFVVKPGADLHQIQMAYRGIEGLTVSDAGDLILKTASGDLRDGRPVAYQEIGGKWVKVEARFWIEGKKSTGTAHPVFIHGFEVENYDPVYPLILDPGLEYSTFLGGRDSDEGLGIAVDTGGNVYVTGYTHSPDFPTTAGVFDTTCGTYGDCNYESFRKLGYSDVFVAKLSSDGSTLLYATYLGGEYEDQGKGIAVDAVGSVYVTGETHSSYFPTTPGAFDTSYNGGGVFVAKLSSNGSALLYSTFLGAAEGNGIAVDDAGNAYVVGSTRDRSTDSSDAFVAKLSADGSILLYSTRLGGSAWDGGYGIALDASGNAYVTGTTSSSDFPTTAGAFDTSFNGGFHTNPLYAFVAKLRSDGTRLFSTFLGGGDWDEGFGIAVDASDNIYVTGGTQSTNFPTTPGAYDTSFNGGYGGFVTKLKTDGSSLLYSTFMDRPAGRGIALDTEGNAYVTGEGQSSVAKLSADGSTLLYSTLLGGSDFLYLGFGIALDTAGNAYVTGTTWSSDFPTTAGAFDISYNGASDAFVARFDLSGLIVNPTPFDFGPINVGSSSSPQTFTVSNAGTANLVIGTIILAGTDAPAFRLHADSCSGQTVVPAGSCTLEAVFAPTFPGAKNATLSISFNTPETPTLDVPLSGIGAAADIRVASSALPDPVTARDHLTYTVLVMNNGPTTATGLLLRDTLPEGVTYVSATLSQGSCIKAGGLVTCDLGTLADGASVTITIVVIPTAPETLTNMAYGEANETDPDATNNTATATTTVDPQQFTLTVIKAGMGNGTVTSSPTGIDCGTDCTENYTDGTSVTLTATSEIGSTFAVWRGACSGTGSCTLIMDSTKTATAIFIIPLTIDPSALEGEVGIPCKVSLGINGGLSPYTVIVVKGSLPLGLSLNPSGIIGIPTKAGSSNFVIQVTDNLGFSKSKKFNMKVFKVLNITTKSLKKGKVGKKYSAVLKTTGGKKPYAWSSVLGRLPEGLILDSSTGKITGIPVASGNFPLIFQATDTLGGTSSKSFTLVIDP